MTPVSDPADEDVVHIALRRHGPAGQVAELVLDRPEALNALSTAMAVSLSSVSSRLRAWGEAGAVRAVVLTSSAARAFCVGADLKERNGFSDAELMDQRPLFRAAFGGVLSLPVPAIAAVHGFALGGGFELALSCDLIVADSTAVFGLPEVTIGLVPGGGGTQLLTRRLGSSRAADLVLSGRRVDVAEGQRLGFVDRRVAAGQARTAALELASQIAGNSPVAVRNAKRALRRGLDVDLAAGLDIEDSAWRATAFAPDRREGIAAFNDRRPPRWP